jgi:hypothetical protein
MQTLSSHMNWLIERRDTLSLGYCFSINVQGKPAKNKIPRLYDGEAE